MSVNVFELLHPRIREGLSALGIEEPTPPQEKGIIPILRGENVLLVAPTASGKTEAALLPLFHRLLVSEGQQGIQLIYVTPMRALNRDILRRLYFWAEHLDLDIQIRHGDTSQSIRRKQLTAPPRVLITTPETLQAILPTERMRQNLRGVNCVVIDEVHELVDSKRGAQLTVGLERLELVTGRPVQRVGLSATVGNPEEVAEFLVGPGRQVEVIEVPVEKPFQYRVEHPMPSEKDFDLAGDLRMSPEAASRLRRINDLIEEHGSTLVFANGRGETEMLGHQLGMINPGVAVHHGSLSREQRNLVEDDLKEGRVKAIVCTSTLQLGIDIGKIDLCIQYHSPRQVSALIQRVGRAGHRLAALSKGVIIAAYSDDALESIAAVRRAREGRLEPLQVHEGALDVLTHQVVGLTMDLGEVAQEEALTILRRAYPYRALSEEEFNDLLDFLVGLRLVARVGGKLRRLDRSRGYYYENLSMIPDERRYPFIDVVTDRVIGTVGEEFWSLRARVGLNVIMRGRVWRIIQIAEEEGLLHVIPSDDPLGALPGWDGELIPVPFELAEETGKLRGALAEEVEKLKSKEVAVEALSKRLGVEPEGLRAAADEVEVALSLGFPVPTDRRIVLEVYDKYLVIHSSFGERVNRTLGCVFDAILSEHELILGWWNDVYRILVEAPRKLDKYDLEKIPAWLFPMSGDEVEKRFLEYLEARFPFGYKMKFIAERFGVLKRGKTTWGSERIEELHRRFKDTPIHRETLREAYQERVDLEKVKWLIGAVSRGEVEVATKLVASPSPFARHILMQYADLEELMAPDYVIRDELDYMKKSLEARTVQLACLNCGEWTEKMRVRNLEEKPQCGKCGSSLLALIERNQTPVELLALFRQWREEKPLSPEEQDRLAYSRKTADLILSYGRKAAIALLVHGVGPQTAYQILSRMHRDEKDLYRDLLKAKIQYLRNRPYWDNKRLT